MKFKIEASHFLSEIFQIKCGKLYINFNQNNERETLSILQNEFNDTINGFKFLECILPGNVTEYVSRLASFGLNLVCVQPIFEKSMENLQLQEPKNIRRLGPSEDKKFARLAATAFHYDRYSLDQYIPRSHVENLYSRWITNDLLGRTDFVLSEENGFCSGKKIKKEGWIDLIAIPVKMRRKGLGTQLVTASLYEFNKMGCTLCKVKTELGNLNGIRLYEGLGFKLVDSTLAFHWHSK